MDNDRLLVQIELSKSILFTADDSVSVSLSGCEVFNQATGNWIPFPEEGVGIAFADSQIRFLLDENLFNYTNGRYKWSSSDSEGSYQPIKL